MTARSSPGSASISPAAETSRSSTQRSVSRVSSSTMSNSSTRLSASSTSVCASNDSLSITGTSWMVPHRSDYEAVASSVGPSSRSCRATIRRATSETGRSTAKAWARSRTTASSIGTPSCTDDHPGRLVHRDAEVLARPQLLGERAGRGVRLHRGHGCGDHVGDHQRVVVLLVAQGPGVVAVQVERTEPHGSDVEGEAEDAADPRLDRWWGEGGPAHGGGVGEVRLDHRPVLTEGVEARSFTQRELQLLHERADRVGRAHGARRRVLEMSVTPAPVTSTTSAATSHSRRLFGSEPLALANRARTSRRRSPVTGCTASRGGEPWLSPWSGRSATKVPSGAFTCTLPPARRAPPEGVMLVRAARGRCAAHPR